MNKKDLVSRIVDVLKQNNIRKRVSAQKTILHISDDFGNNSDFIVKKSDTGLLFTAGDVNSIIDACIAVVEDAIKQGESISIHGFGTLGVNRRAERHTKHPDTGDEITINARYVPKFNFGNSLRMAAKVYEMSLSEKE